MSLCRQGCIKRDPDGHADDFALQWRHFKACLDIFNLKPSKDSKEFADLVAFIAQVCLSAFAFVAEVLLSPAMSL